MYSRMDCSRSATLVCALRLIHCSLIWLKKRSTRLSQDAEVGHMRQVLVRGIKKVDQMFVLTMAGYNLTRLRNLGQIRLQGQM